MDQSTQLLECYANCSWLPFNDDIINENNWDENGFKKSVILLNRICNEFAFRAENCPKTNIVGLQLCEIIITNKHYPNDIEFMKSWRCIDINNSYCQWVTTIEKSLLCEYGWIIKYHHY